MLKIQKIFLTMFVIVITFGLSTASAQTTTYANNDARCPYIPEDLYQGLEDIVDNGPIMQLQRFLISRGLLSADSATGFFGRKTRAALALFQESVGILPASGNFGPRTRAQVALQCTNGGAITPTPPRLGCNVQGAYVADGSQIQMYSQQEVASGVSCSLFVQNRTCSNGVLQGSDAYRYTTCRSATAQSCSVGSLSIADGASQTFYNRTSVSYGQSCASYGVTRSCSNGVMVGGDASYQFPSCAATTANSCVIGGQTVQDGSSITLYSRSSVEMNASCANYSQSRTCSNGVLLGDTSFAHTSCAPATSSSCTLGSVVLTNGQSRYFYNASTVPFGASCDAIKLSRTCSQGVLTGDSAYGHATCSVSTGASCQLDGVTFAHGTSHTFYSQSTVQNGKKCSTVSLSRKCTNGTIGGNAQYNKATCTVASPASCTLDGVTVAHGTAHNFYSRAVQPIGKKCSDVVLSRKCTNGSLSGSGQYNKANCTVDRPDSCTLDGVTVAHGKSRKFFSADTVAFGSTCDTVADVRTCNNGRLEGSSRFNKASCAVTAAKSCVLDEQTVAHGDSYVFYLSQTIQEREQCGSYAQRRTCTDGKLNGSAAYRYKSCTRSTATTCVMDSKEVASGSSADFYLSTRPEKGKKCESIKQNRTCTNGVLSGATNYNRATCSDDAACVLDGQTVVNGSHFVFFKESSVPFGQACATPANSQTRNCTNGQLDGSNAFSKARCATVTAKSCTLDGKVVAHDASETFFSAATLPFGRVCTDVAQTRKCVNGALDGSAAYKYKNCSVTQAKTCSLDGKTIEHDATAIFYTTPSVPFGNLCADVSQERKCTNGQLSGTSTFKYKTCRVSPPEATACVLDGVSVAHGTSRRFYSDNKVPYGKTCAEYDQSRACTNGRLSGSATYKYATCGVASPRSCELDGVKVDHGDSRNFFSQRTVPHGQNCGRLYESRKCTNGTLSGSAQFKYKTCAPAK